MMDKKLSLPPLARNLSARLLLLTIAFVMLAEVLIYAPSVGRFRLVHLEERLAAAHLAILALDATPDQMIGKDLERELLEHVRAYSVGLTRPGGGKLMLMMTAPGPVDASFDLREASFFGLIGDAFVTLLQDRDRVLRVVGVSPKDRATLVEVVLDEAPLRAGMIGYSERILALSLGISLFTAALVYLSLHLLMVRPLRRITDSMSRFRADPEDPSRIIKPSARRDEVGVAQRELAEMQVGLRGALQQRARLAALGAGVTRISHDLGNILATARLVSDRLSNSEDPEVRRVAPTLLGAIDRAVNLCAQTLSFTREGAPKVERSRFDLGELVSEVGASLPEQLRDRDPPRGRRRPRAAAPGAEQSGAQRHSGRRLADRDRRPPGGRPCDHRGPRRRPRAVAARARAPVRALRRLVAARRHRPRFGHRARADARPWRRHPPRTLDLRRHLLPPRPAGGLNAGASDTI
jgi:hypothetical protein